MIYGPYSTHERAQEVARQMARNNQPLRFVTLPLGIGYGVKANGHSTALFSYRYR
jgi:hypothetical protein